MAPTVAAAAAAAAPTRAPRQESVKEVARALSRKILRRWTTPLKPLRLCHDHIEFAVSSISPQKTQLMWVHCDAGRIKNPETMLRDVSEGMALLGILRQLDFDVWKTTVCSIWTPDDPRHPTELHHLGISIVITRTRLLEWISERLVGVEAISEAYKLACKSVGKRLVACGEKDVAAQLTKTVPKIPLLVNIDIEDRDQEMRRGILRQLLQMAIVQHRLECAAVSKPDTFSVLFNAHERSCFTFVGIDIVRPTVHRLNEQEVEYLRRMVEHDILVYNLRSYEISDISKHARIAALRTFFPTEVASRRHLIGGVDTVVIFEPESRKSLVPLLSTLQVRQSVSTVKMFMANSSEELDNDDRARRRELWKWIGYALLSRHARHCVNKLHIDASFLEASDIDAMQSVLSAINPLQVLFPTAATCPHHQSIQASHFLSISHGGITTSAADYTSPIVVRVITCICESSVNLWSVLLPGYGEAWVEDREAVPVAEDEHPPRRSKPSRSQK